MLDPDPPADVHADQERQLCYWQKVKSDLGDFPLLNFSIPCLSSNIYIAKMCTSLILKLAPGKNSAVGKVGLENRIEM